jgi:hypothetical protein
VDAFNVLTFDVFVTREPTNIVDAFSVLTFDVFVTREPTNIVDAFNVLTFDTVATRLEVTRLEVITVDAESELVSMELDCISMANSVPVANVDTIRPGITRVDAASVESMRFCPTAVEKTRYDVDRVITRMVDAVMVEREVSVLTVMTSLYSVETERVLAFRERRARELPVRVEKVPSPTNMLLVARVDTCR